MNYLSRDIDSCNETTAPSFRPATIRTVTGEYLAKNRLDARGRAKLAADIIAGRAEITGLTIKQITRLCKTNRVYLDEARSPARSWRRQQRKMAKVWEAVEPDCRAELCRTIGVERVWNALAQAVG